MGIFNTHQHQRLRSLCRATAVRSRRDQPGQRRYDAPPAMATGPFRRKQSRPSPPASADRAAFAAFSMAPAPAVAPEAMIQAAATSPAASASRRVVEDSTPARAPASNPTSPDADKDGYVAYPGDQSRAGDGRPDGLRSRLSAQRLRHRRLQAAHPAVHRSAQELVRNPHQAAPSLSEHAYDLARIGNPISPQISRAGQHRSPTASPSSGIGTGDSSSQRRLRRRRSRPP